KMINSTPNRIRVAKRSLFLPLLLVTIISPGYSQYCFDYEGYGPEIHDGLFNIHDRERTNACTAGPSFFKGNIQLRYDDILARKSFLHASYMAETGTFEDPAMDDLITEINGQTMELGVNKFKASGAGFIALTDAQMLEYVATQWSNQKWFFTGRGSPAPIYTSISCMGGDCSDLITMWWGATEYIGCAVARNPATLTIYAVCHYGPRGLINGQPIFECQSDGNTDWDMLREPSVIASDGPNPPLITGRDTTVSVGASVDLSTLLSGTPQGTLEYGTTYGTYDASEMIQAAATTTYFVRDSSTFTECVDTAQITVRIQSNLPVQSELPVSRGPLLWVLGAVILGLSCLGIYRVFR
ncbi:MAG: CAP domain-containing protein, partial [Bacteroidota bacterium]